jgi:hypothetical protein
MIVGIHQPNYLPWLGFFNKMARSDVFVLFDDVQLVRGKSFMVRNRIKTANGVQWLTVPVQGKSDLVLIKDAVLLQTGKWQQKHWKSIQLSYRKAPFFARYEEKFSQIYQSQVERLCDLNIALIKLIREIMQIKTELVLSSELNIEAKGEEKILAIVKKFKGDRYITGEGAGSQRYVREEDFRESNIELIYQQFRHPIYNQLWGDFISDLSIIDLLFNEGERSLSILMEDSS